MVQLSLNALQGLGLKWSHRAHAVTPERARAYYARLETGVNCDWFVVVVVVVVVAAAAAAVDVVVVVVVTIVSLFPLFPLFLL